MAARAPRRTCAGCGRVARKSNLIRIVAVPDTRSVNSRKRTAVLDPDARMPGRGAYLCRDGAANRPAPACLRQALRRGGIARALRCAVKVPEELVESMGR